MASVNRTLNPEAETLFLAADSRYAFLSSSAARELGALGAELGSFVPGCVEKALRRQGRPAHPTQTGKKARQNPGLLQGAAVGQSGRGGGHIQEVR